jgi:transcriptional regulator with XRE-family HTH domain
VTTSLLREARERARLTQKQLAERSGIAQSTISAYESGKREPGVEALTKLLDAAGFGLALRPRRPTDAEAGRILAGVMDLAHTIRRSRARA